MVLRLWVAGSYQAAVVSDRRSACLSRRGLWMCADMDSTRQGTRLAGKAKGDLPGTEARCFQFVVMAHLFAKQYSVSHKSQGSTCLDCVSVTLNKQMPNHEIRKNTFSWGNTPRHDSRRWPNFHKLMGEPGSAPGSSLNPDVVSQPTAYCWATVTHCWARSFTAWHGSAC